MKRLLFGAPILFAALACAQEFKLGSKVQDFSLTSVDGKSVNLSALKGSTTAILFVATKCPISNDYNERMKAVYNDYAGKGVKFVFINSNVSEPADEVKDHAKNVGFTFPVYKDNDSVVADKFGAQVTPEVFLLDKDGVIRYHGYVDDSRNEARVSKKGMRLALDAMLAGKTPETAETKAFGCTIKRGKKAAKPTT